jgi:hypothetical protein
MTIIDVVNVDRQPDMMNVDIKLLDTDLAVRLAKLGMFMIKKYASNAMTNLQVQNFMMGVDTEPIGKTIAY